MRKRIRAVQTDLWENMMPQCEKAMLLARDVEALSVSEESVEIIKHDKRDVWSVSIKAIPVMRSMEAADDVRSHIIDAMRKAKDVLRWKARACLEFAADSIGGDGEEEDQEKAEAVA